jgi:DNA-binding Lrp family transcriptional regulator
MASIVSLKNPSKIIQALVTKPMTKWALKQKTKLAYSRVHEAVSLLEDSGYVKTFGSVTSKRGRAMKTYGLTFKGIVAYLASISIKPPSQIGNAGESIDAFKERYAQEKKKYLKEIEDLTQLLEYYGKGELLDYALFMEIRWLTGRYGPYIGQDILEIAKFTEAYPPFPTGASQMIKHYKKQKKALEQQKQQILQNPDLQEKRVVSITEEGKTEETTYDPLAEVYEDLRHAEEGLAILLRKENEWWGRRFATLFSERIHFLKGKGNMRNEALYKFFTQVAEKNRELEVESVEKMAEVFRDSTA